MSIYSSKDQGYIREVKRLIRMGKEGSYWDFKQEYHDRDDKVSLLHDIICLSNNLENRPAFLIYGVDDKGSIIGLECERWRESDLNDWFMNIPFIGGFRPSLHVIDCEDISILVITPDTHVPYYLHKDYSNKKGPRKDKMLGSGRIFTRNGDKNTNRDTTAMYSEVDTLYRIRYGLDKDIFTRMSELLENRENWTRSKGNVNDIYHHKYCPEFTLRVTRTNNIVDGSNQKDGPHYRLALPGKSSEEVLYEFYYNTVLIHSERGFFLDSVLYVNAPRYDWVYTSTEGFDINSRYFYNYDLEDDIFSYRFGKLLWYLSEQDNPDKVGRRMLYYKTIPMFKSENEREHFIAWFKLECRRDNLLQHIDGIGDDSMTLYKNYELSRLMVKKLYDFRGDIKIIE